MTNPGDEISVPATPATSACGHNCHCVPLELSRLIRSAHDDEHKTNPKISKTDFFIFQKSTSTDYVMIALLR